MNTTPSGGVPDRDYSTISPSARSLLFMKGHTDIPFARKAASLLQHPASFEPDFTNPDFRFWARVVHFEHRYKSINQLLNEVPVHNILELSSGFSFRGLAAMQQAGVHYIDTDLPGIISLKQSFVSSLQEAPPATGSQLEILPLNALDETQMRDTAEHFPAGNIAVVNEGLLMYLDDEEKQQLCSIIRSLLEKRGGYWITADVYLKRPHAHASMRLDDKLGEFFEEHRITEKMFDSFEAAAAFFNNAGFVVDKEAETDYAALSTLPYLMQSATAEQLTKLGGAGKLQATWRLRLA